MMLSFPVENLDSNRSRRLAGDTTPAAALPRGFTRSSAGPARWPRGAGVGWNSRRVPHPPRPREGGREMATLTADTVAAAGGGRRAVEMGSPSPRCSSSAAAAAARSLTLSTAPRRLGRRRRCDQNPAVGGHVTAADARAVSRLLQEPPRAPGYRPRRSRRAGRGPAAWKKPAAAPRRGEKMQQNGGWTLSLTL